MNSKWTSLNPPAPGEGLYPSISNSSNGGDGGSSSLEGRHLLNLLKALERETKGDGDEEGQSKEGKKAKALPPSVLSSSSFLQTKMSILDILSSMENLYLRRGLLEYDTERAHEMQTKMNDQSMNGIGGERNNNGKKRKRGGLGGKGSANIASILGIDGGNSNSSAGKEAYVLSNLCRVLIPVSSSSTSTAASPSDDREFFLRYPPVVVNATCSVLIAICNHCSNHLPSSTASMEQSMIVSIASQLISGISKTIHLLLAVIEHDSNLACTQSFKALSNCCTCASVLISLAGNRLSRSVKVMENIQNATESLMWYQVGKQHSYDEKLMSEAKESAASLLSSIPLASNPNGVSSSLLWTNSLQLMCKNLSTTLIAFYPLLKRKVGNRRKIREGGYEKLTWIEEVKEKTTSQLERIQIFFMRIDGYVSIIKSFLGMDRYGQMNSDITCAIPMAYLLDILEQMLSFTSVAESNYLATKPRLRNLSVEGGLLSPKAALMIANNIKYHGHILFQMTVSLLSSSSLSYGKQIIRITTSALESSCSKTLRSVIDPVSVVDKNSSKKWLHSSISLRSMSVQSFSCAMQRLGSNAIVSQSETVIKGIVYIVGFLIEQISSESADSEKEMEYEHWGTPLERTKLVETCIETLATCVSICGAYMPITNREMVESVAITCLDNICGEGHGSIYCNHTEIKMSILRFGVSCISTPWSDGSASSIVSRMRRVASYLRFDRNPAVSSSAYTALTICNCLATPRAPPLVIVTRDKKIAAFGDAMSSSFSKAAIEEGINNAREVIEQQRDKAELKKDEVKVNKVEEVSIVDPPNKSEKAEKLPIVDDERGFDENKGRPIEQKSEVDEVAVIPPIAEESSSKESYEEEEPKKIQEPEISKDDSPPWSKEELQTIDSKIASSNEEDSDDEGFPMIVDCDPDDEDME